MTNHIIEKTLHAERNGIMEGNIKKPTSIIYILSFLNDSITTIIVQILAKITEIKETITFFFPLIVHEWPQMPD